VFAITSAAVGEPLSDGLALCRVASWLTGIRAVSLPFSDHCEPLVNGADQLVQFTERLAMECDRQRWKYVELRPCTWDGEVRTDFSPSQSHCFHKLDLSPSLEQLFRGLHRDSIQRKIRRAEREKISYETGRTDRLLNEFYGLLLITRRRHRLFPQPRAWFKNLVECTGEQSQIRVARKDGVPLAAMLTLRHRSSIVYKYGCSDEKYHPLGAVPFLFWKLIEESKARGAEELDFGRSELDNAGLITFKDRFGAQRLSLTYFRYPPTNKTNAVFNWGQRSVAQLVSYLPDRVLPAAGRVLYKHLG
jgi:lipid II:glycine glycyltransferase (peptidoglycan interpeptide bridge formation enzyme)